MKDSIVITHLATVKEADIDGFQDVLLDTLGGQDSDAEINTVMTTPHSLDGAAVRIEWVSEFSFTTPDGVYKFGCEKLKLEVTGDNLDHTLLLKLLVVRNHQLEEGYRKVLHDIYGLAADIREGKFTPEGDAMEYLTKTLEAAVEAIPNID